jgi:hypothetical protein
MMWVIGLCLLCLVCGCSDDSVVNPNTPENRIGPAGGTVRSATGELTLTIPAGALQDDLDFTVELESAPDEAGGTYKIVSPVYSLGPAGTVFGVAATVSLIYDETALGPAAENSVVLCACASSGLGWEVLETTADGAVNRAAAPITHLSDFAVMVDTVLPTTVETGGYIYSDTTWGAKDTVLVTASVYVTGEASLTIEPGARILFNLGTGLNVYGNLIATGTESRPILFTSAADIAGGAPAAGDWDGIRFNRAGGGTLSRSVIRYGINDVYISESSPQITHCLIEEFKQKGIYIDGPGGIVPLELSVTECLIRQRSADYADVRVGVFIYEAVDITIADCAISNCHYGIQFQGQVAIIPHFQVTGCDIREHRWYGIYALAGG